MENILELDKQRYSGGVPRFLQFYRKAQMRIDAIIKVDTEG